MASFRTADRLTGFLLPPSIGEWLPERHPARFVVEVIEGLDLTALKPCSSRCCYWRVRRASGGRGHGDTGPNAKNQTEPIPGEIDGLPDEPGRVDTLPADTGYFSAATVAACEAAGIDPLVASGRQPHHPPLGYRFYIDP